MQLPASELPAGFRPRQDDAAFRIWIDPPRESLPRSPQCSLSDLREAVVRTQIRTSRGPSRAINFPVWSHSNGQIQTGARGITRTPWPFWTEFLAGTKK